MVDSQTSSSSCPAKGQPSQFLVNAAPCRMLAWGKNLLNVKSCVSPTGPDHSKNKETGFSDHCHQTGPVSGGRRDSNVCQTSKCHECGTHLPVGSRLTPFSGLRKPWGGWTLGSTNVEGGLYSPFPVNTKLDKVTQIINCYAHLCKISGLLQPCLVPKPHNLWRPIRGLSKPNLSETIRTILQQWEWVTSLDFKDAYFHIPIQEQSRTYQISCPGSDIPVQKHCLSVCPLHPWSSL